MEVKEIIKISLNVPVIELFEPILPPCATCYSVRDSTGLSGDGDETEIIETYQIDIWDRRRQFVQSSARKLKLALKTAELQMTIPEISYTYDNNGKIWRATLTVSMIGKEI